MDDDNHKEATASTAIHVGNAAALIGSLTAATIFMGLYNCWTFGRGMMEAIGFPVSLTRFSTSIDLYPEVALQYTAVFMASALLGLVPKHKLDTRILIPILIGFFGIGVSYTFDINNRVLRALLMSAALVGPFLAVYIIRMFRNQPIGLLLGVVVTLNALSVYSENLYLFGKEQGRSVLSQPANTWAEGGMAASKMSEYPLVSIVSSEKLALRTNVSAVERSYVYRPQGKDFLRLVVSDENYYYFVENVDNNAVPIAISKSLVTQIQFIK
jgi:hypothetical protein